MIRRPSLTKTLALTCGPSPPWAAFAEHSRISARCLKARDTIEGFGAQRSPHPASSVGHLLPWGEGCACGSLPSPWGEGGPRPALSPAGAGRVKGTSLKCQPPSWKGRLLQFGVHLRLRRAVVPLLRFRYAASHVEVQAPAHSPPAPQAVRSSGLQAGRVTGYACRQMRTPGFEPKRATRKYHEPKKQV